MTQAPAVHRASDCARRDIERLVWQTLDIQEAVRPSVHLERRERP